MYKSTKIILFALLAVLACTAVNAAALYAPEWRTTDLEVSLTGPFIGGFDILPNGNYLINDGGTVREVSRIGEADKTLYTYEASVYGSFARYNPYDGKVYFGNSSNGDISAFTYTNPKDVAHVTTIDYNFDMDFRNGLPYVSASNSSWTESMIYLVGSTSNDLIASCVGPSGPVAFDAAGNLIYIPASSGSTTRIIEWTNAQITGAIGPTSLSWTAATPLATIKGGYGSAMNLAGGLMFTNNSISPAAIQVYKNGAVGTFATFDAPGGTSPFISMVRQNSTTGDISAVVSYADASGYHTVVSTMTPAPEPSSIMAFCSLIGLAGSVGLLRRRRK